MRLVKLQDVSSKQVTAVDLLLNSIFGDKVPTKFVPNNYYRAGDHVYDVDPATGMTIIYKCIRNGTYPSTNSNGFTIFNPSTGESGEYQRFEEGGTYARGDKVFTTDDDGGVRIFENVIAGTYRDLTDQDAWKEYDFNKDGGMSGVQIDSLLKELFGGNFPSRFDPNIEYKAGDNVYVVNPDGGISVSTCIKDGVYDNTDGAGWKSFDTSKLTGNSSKGIDPSMYATDDDIKAMFDLNPGESELSKFNKYLRDDNRDGNLDTTWTEF